MQTLPLTRDLVLIGGGHSHALVLKRWGMQALPGVRVTVIDHGPTATYSGMLPGFVAGHYAADDSVIDLVRLADFAAARLILGPVTGIDLTARTITVPGRPPVAFDVASVNVGITSAMPDLPGFAEYGVPVKPLTAFAKRWAEYCATTVEPQVVVIGGGVAGAELAMAMAYALRDRQAQITIVDRGKVLAAMSAAARNIVLTKLREFGITLVEDGNLTSVNFRHVLLEDGREIAATFTVGAAGAILVRTFIGPVYLGGAYGDRGHGRVFVGVGRFF